MLDILDAVTQGAVDDNNVRAASLAEAATGPWIGDAWPHIDYPGATGNYVDGPLQGLNVHLTLGGEGMARFTQTRQWKLVDDIATTVVDLSKVKVPRIMTDTFIGHLLSWHPDMPFTPWTQILPGDIVIFQAAAQRPDYLPSGHEFMSATEDRRLIVMSPQAAPQDEVLLQRQKFVKRLGLGSYAMAAPGYG